MSGRNTVAEQWNALLDTYSAEFQGKQARLEVVGSTGTQHVIIGSGTFRAIGADLKNGEHNVIFSVESPDGSLLNHTVTDVNAIEVISYNTDVARIELTADNDTTTVLTLH